jgi:hypothetical protein
MNYNWFKIFNKNEFISSGLVSRTYTLDLEGIGQQDVLATRGESIGVTHDGVFLILELNGENPFKFDDKAVYVDANNDVYLGFLIES